MSSFTPDPFLKIDTFDKKSAKILNSLFGKAVFELCWSATIKPRVLEGSIFSTGPQRTNLSLQTDLGSLGCLGFSYRGG